MNVSLVITVIGPDRPGLVEAISRTIAEHDANWQASRMVRLASKFAGVVHVAVPDPRAEPLRKALNDLEGEGLVVVVERSDEAPTEGQRTLRMDVVGHDRPGIIKQASHALSTLGVNVVELSTGLRSAPMSGEVLFHANAELVLPEGVTIAEVRSALESIAHDLMVDVTLVEDEKH